MPHEPETCQWIVKWDDAMAYIKKHKFDTLQEAKDFYDKKIKECEGELEDLRRRHRERGCPEDELEGRARSNAWVNGVAADSWNEPVCSCCHKREGEARFEYCSSLVSENWDFHVIPRETLQTAFDNWYIADSALANSPRKATSTVEKDDDYADMPELEYVPFAAEDDARIEKDARIEEMMQQLQTHEEKETSSEEKDLAALEDASAPDDGDRDLMRALSYQDLVSPP